MLVITLLIVLAAILCLVFLLLLSFILERHGETFYVLTAGGADLKGLKRLRMTPPSSPGNDQQNSKLSSKTTLLVNTRRREAAEKRLRIRIRNYGKTQLGLHEVSLE